MDLKRLQSDFDNLARLAGREMRTGRYDTQLVAAIPRAARRVLDVGCGSGALAVAAARSGREVIGVDLSPGMIEHASLAAAHSPNVAFQCGDFFALEFEPHSFDCIISSATLHHMPADAALNRMSSLLRPGGRLIVHDLLSNTRVGEDVCASIAFLHETGRRFLNTGRLRPPREVREAWKQHGAGEVYLTRQQVRDMAHRHLAGARIVYHWLWRYTLIWDKPDAGLNGG
jgi:ubiquinone/menaquinone biosynthesis C-methylase UbiE